ncbi:MAG TPA: hypothetical protein DCZ23_00670, partial [Lachnospiraceae bacterium]|nr:hypothetical protein [Lachnospiraceae bacterium]
MEKKINRTDAMFYMLSFSIPVTIFLIIMYKSGFYPFGDKTLFIMDMKGQYLEFYASLRNIASSDDSIFFSWSRSMGGNYLGLFAYYLASPLSFITLFFSIRNLAAGILVLTLLKLGLCGLSFSIFASYLWKKHCNGTGFIMLLFSTSYALLSYNMVYSLCPMWMDGVIFLPLVILGVEKILHGGKGMFYIIMLAALFICNYYTGYMTGIFAALYFIYRILCVLSKDKLRQCLQNTLHFTISSVLAILLPAPLIIPVLKDLLDGKLSNQSYMPDNTTNFEKLSDLLGKFTNGVYDSITNSGLPAIYCGYLALTLAVAFFLLRRIAIREKIGAAVIIGIFWFSFYYVKLDIAWHGFQYPTWFPYRYAFLFSFVILYMAIRSVCIIITETDIGKLFLEKKIPGYATFIILAVILAGNSYDMGRNGTLLLDGLNSEFAYGTLEEYNAFLDKTEPLVKNIQSSDSGFYRINQGYEYSKNDSLLLGYNGMTHYSSTFNSAINILTPKLGLAQTHIWNSGYGSNQLLDSLFAVKYILADRSVPASYTRLEDTGYGSASYANNTALSIAYSARVASTAPDIDTGNVYTNQNNFINAITGIPENYYTELAFQSDQQGNNCYLSFTASSDNPIYLYMSSPEAYWANVYVNENFAGNYFTSETKCSLYLGTFTKDETVTVRIESNEAFSLDMANIAELSTALLTNSLAQLQENGMNIEEHKAGKLYGTINVREGEKIMTSIPGSAGWTVKIDGKKTEPQLFAGTFMVLETSPGEHTISFSYISPGFTTGCIIFIAALLLCIVYCKWEKIVTIHG